MLLVTCAIIVRSAPPTGEEHATDDSEDQRATSPVDSTKVLACQRSATMKMPLKWEFPGGKLEEGEAPDVCIKRELKEELGIEVELLWRGPDAPYPLEAPQITLIPFVVRITGGLLHPVEHAEIRWCTPEELPHLDWAPADVPVLDWWLESQS